MASSSSKMAADESIPSSRGNLNPKPAESEDHGLRWLLGIGAVVVLVVWAVEWHAGLINPWDKWLLPLLSASLIGFLLALRWAPQRARLTRLGCVLTFNAFLVVTLLVLLATGGDRPNEYQFLSTMYWLPLGYGVGFVFLPVRWALAVSVAVCALIFVPIGVAALLGASPTRWPESFATLVTVLAVAQVAYIVLLRTVATVRAQYHRAHERMQVMQALAGTDMLTALPNRRAMTEHLNDALSFAERKGQPVVVALLDIDHFKRINDIHGHKAGDAALIAVGRVLTSQVREFDYMGRWGGEEFLLVAPDTPMHAGLEIVERLRKAVAAWEFEHGEPLTVSVGLSQYLAGDKADELLQRADKALYRAKDNGRNRTEVMAVASAA